MPKIPKYIRYQGNKVRVYSKKYPRSLHRGAHVRGARRAFFKKKVNKVVMSNQPTQYRLYGKNRDPVSQLPIVFENCSNIKALQENTNPRFYRSSMKIKPIGITFKFRAWAQDLPNNQICVAFVRHRRTDPIVDADIQNGTAPQTSQNDKPFMNLNDPNQTALTATQMTGTSNFAIPSMLLKLMNPKVVDVLKTWTVNLQPTSAPNDAGTSNYKPYRDWEYTYRFKSSEVWKYPAMRDPESEETTFPYNNKCYQLLAWSDSVALTSHPALSVVTRFSFKDVE